MPVTLCMNLSVLATGTVVWHSFESSLARKGAWSGRIRDDILLDGSNSSSGSLGKISG